MSNGLGNSGAGVLKSLILVSLFMFSLFSMMAPEAELGPELERYETSSQNTLLWSQHVAGSSSTDSVESIEMDDYGNTYVCGYYYNMARFGNINLNSMGSTDGYVGKIGPSGNWLWAKSLGGSSSDQCKDIDVDSGGNCTQPGIFSLFYGIPPTYWDATVSQHRPPVLLDELHNIDIVIDSSGVEKNAIERSIMKAIITAFSIVPMPGF